MPSSLSSTLRQVRRLTTSITGAILKLRAEHYPDKALEIHSSIPTSTSVSSRYAQDLAVKSLAKSGRFSDIEVLLEPNKKSPKISEEPFLSALIRSYGRAGMFSHALSTYNQMEELNTPRSTFSFNALLAACNDCRLFEKVPQLFDEMSKRHGIHPDKFSYGNLVKAYCGMESLELAMKTVEDMEDKGVEITAVTLTTIMDEYFKKSMVDEANAAWEKMVKKGCVDTAAYNVRIMHISNSEPESIQTLMEDMKTFNLKPDTTTYNYLMSSYCNLGMIDEAKKVYMDIERNGCNPNSYSFRTLILHMCKKGRFVQGYEIFKKSVRVKRIPEPETLKLMLEGLMENKRRREVMAVIRTLKKVFPDTSLTWLHKFEKDFGLVKLGEESSKTQVEHDISL